MNYSLGNIISNGGVLKRLDPDAAAFIAATGATDVANINAWVLGLKSQGIWNNIVCWPMRSTQNHGSGTVLRSLGGLGSFNGTLVNGPQWTANGLSFSDASSQRVTLGASQILSANSDYTIFSVAQLVNSVNPNISVLNCGNNRGSGISAASNGSTQVRNVSWDNVGSFTGGLLSNGPTTSMFSAFAAGNSTNVRHFANSATPFNTTNGDYRIRPSQTLLETIGAFNNATNSYIAHFNGLIPFSAIMNVSLTNAQVLSVLNLYRTTLGAGLGLP